MLEEISILIFGTNIEHTNDVEDKWVAAPTGVTFTPNEIEKAVNFHEQYFRHEIEICKADQM